MTKLNKEEAYTLYFISDTQLFKAFTFSYASDLWTRQSTYVFRLLFVYDLNKLRRCSSNDFKGGVLYNKFHT